MKLYNTPVIAPLSEPITVTYLDLDRLLEAAELTKVQRNIIELLMQGWSRRDVAEVLKIEADTVVDALNIAVDEIVERNEYEWHHFHTKSFAG